jgi:predicted nuclease of restriction endonuclease-like (RecB) superfamily
MAVKKVNVGGMQYSAFVKELVGLFEQARHYAAIAVNSILTATYWETGRRIVEFEQHGRKRAEYGEELLTKLSQDLTKQFGRGFSRQNLQQMRQFYLTFPPETICQTLSGKSEYKHDTIKKSESPIRKFSLQELSGAFPLSWSHYVRLITVKDQAARDFYETEALRGGWTVRQLTRQIDSQFYERTVLSKNKAAMLKRGSRTKAEDIVTPEEEIRDPYILEFLGLKDEYSENDLEEALIYHLEHFLLELGNDFAFVGRQKRLRIGDEWFRVDLLFFHRRLRCLVIIDLKIGRFTHADAGQMHMYLNYAREHWTQIDENPPIGLILCAQKNSAVAKYSLEGLPNKVLVSEYRLQLPDEKILADEINKARKAIEQRTGARK